MQKKPAGLPLGIGYPLPIPDHVILQTHSRLLVNVKNHTLSQTTLVSRKKSVATYVVAMIQSYFYLCVVSSILSVSF